MTAGLRKGLALAILWAQVPAAHRADVESWAASEPLAPTDPAVGVLAVGRYVGISGAPAFIEVHELVNDDAMVVSASGTLMATTLRALERFGAAILPGGAAGEAGGSRAGSVGPAGVYGQVFPPGTTSGPPSTGCRRRSRLAGSTSRRRTRTSSTSGTTPSISSGT